jgi:hypothetical protein
VCYRVSFDRLDNVLAVAKRLHQRCGAHEGTTGNVPAVFVEFLYQNPHHFAERFGAFELDHHIRDHLGHRMFLFRRKDGFNQLDIDKGHVGVPFWIAETACL